MEKNHPYFLVRQMMLAGFEPQTNTLPPTPAGTALLAYGGLSTTGSLALDSGSGSWLTAPVSGSTVWEPGQAVGAAMAVLGSVKVRVP